MFPFLTWDDIENREPRRVPMLVEVVSRLKPGDRIDVSVRELGSPDRLDPIWTVPDCVLTKIVGSAYEFFYRVNEMNRTVTFGRREKPTDGSVLAYVDPDRRTYMRQRLDGLWEWSGANH